MKDIYLNLSIEEITLELEIEKKQIITIEDKETLKKIKKALVDTGLVDINTPNEMLANTIKQSLIDLKPENIKKGVIIAGVVGTYEPVIPDEPDEPVIPDEPTLQKLDTPIIELIVVKHKLDTPIIKVVDDEVITNTSSILGKAVLGYAILGNTGGLINKLDTPVIELIEDEPKPKLSKPIIRLEQEELPQLDTPIIRLEQIIFKLDAPVIDIVEV